MKTATILLRKEDQEKIKSKVSKFIESYENFVLVEVTDEQIKSLQKEGSKVVVKSEIENIQFGQVTIDTTQPRYDERGAILAHSAYARTEDVSPGKHHYFVQFKTPVKEEWKKTIQDLGGVILEPLPVNSYFVEMDGDTREKVRVLPFVKFVGAYAPEMRISAGLLKDLKEEEEFERRGERAATFEKPEAPSPKIKPISKVATTLPGEYSVSFHTEENMKDAIPRIEELGAEIHGQYGNTITCSILPGKLIELAQIHGVKKIDSVKIRKLRNNIATKIMCGSPLSSKLNLQLTGKGEIIGVADSGIDTGDPSNIHGDFKGRVVGIKSWAVQPEFKDRATNIGDDDGTADEVDGHGTHVAGSVLGNGQKSWEDPGGAIRGLATEAKLYFQAVEQLLAYTNDYVKWYRRKYLSDPPGYELAGLPQDLKILFQEAYDEGVRIHTNSWGGGDGPVYDEQSEHVDRFVWEHKDMVILFAAGNDGSDKDGDGKVDLKSITPPGTAKNCICVGASENIRDSGGYNPGGDCSLWGNCWPDDFPKDPIKSDRLSNKDSDIAAFSSRGPCVDNRFKPDVVAPGTNILSARSSLEKFGGWGLLPANDPKRAFYMYMGGTSMATPLVAGAVALIRQYLRQKGLDPSASLVKAALINATVRKPYRYTTAKSSDLWDAHMGFGHVNLKPFIADSGKLKMEFVDGAGLSTGELKDYSFEVTDISFPFKATLVYTDYPARPDQYPSIVNNLNLIVTAPDGKDYHGNQFTPPFDSSFDSVNNVEIVNIMKPKKGKYKVNVLASNVSVGPQDYSLVVSGGIVSAK